ncbi:hypothetical protein EUX98_g4844 [Antrodiella citrinella]|uniref:Transmembrane protein n=1 Tax=Antrodiella citrinella TaxID=2447956 RepID=A0A4S4N0X7_9APHY|nr:hypothetical protein EUX98_g4844 [Antrodiella citrinella]
MSSSTSWNITIDDASPVLQYAPYSDGPLTNGWQAWYSNAPNPLNPSCGEASAGDSQHITSHAGASVSLQFNGNAIYLYGTSNSSYQVSLDNTVQNLSPPSGDLLYLKQNLSSGTHYVNLTALPSAGQQLLFDKAIITDSLPGGSDLPTTTTYDNSNTSAVQYFGSWSSKTDAQVPNALHPMPFHITTSSGSYASLNFTGGIAVAVNGSKNCGHGLYTIKLFDSTQQFQTSSEYNASTNWLVGDALLYYYSGLDPTKNYEVQVSNSGGDGTTLTLGDFTVFQSNITTTIAGNSSDTSDHNVNVGVIVGPIIAGVAVLCLLTLAIFLLRRRAHRASQRAEGKISPYSTDIIPPAAAPPGGPGFSLEKGNASQALPGPAAAPNPNQTPPGVNGTSLSSAASAPATLNSQTNLILPPPAPAQPVDVNRIIELIAARIDRPVVGMAMDPDALAPPQYPQPIQSEQPQPQQQSRMQELSGEQSNPPRYRK